MHTALTPASTARRIAERAGGPSARYTWYQSAASVSAAITSMPRLERLLTTIVVLAAAAPRAVSSSPSGWKSFCAATGPITVGANMRCPNSSVDRSSPVASTISFWRKVMRSNGVRLPPVRREWTPAGSTVRAAASNSATLISSSLGGRRGPSWLLMGSPSGRRFDRAPPGWAGRWPPSPAPARPARSPVRAARPGRRMPRDPSAERGPGIRRRRPAPGP